MSDESALTPQEALERAQARLREEEAKVAALKRIIAEAEVAGFDCVLRPKSAPAAEPMTAMARVSRSTGVQTIAELIEHYKTNKDSGYLKAQYVTRLNYISQLKRIGDNRGHEKIADLKAQDILRFHEEWKGRGQASARSLVGMLRMLFGFGATVLGDGECERLSVVMHKMRFKMMERRGARLTAQHANAIRAMAHKMEYPLVALAQAFQFDCKLGQKDVIGEWVPQNEPGMSDVLNHTTGKKWLRGLRWSEIDENLILRHRKKTINLRNHPMVMEELERIGLDKLPTGGPIITNQNTGRPYLAQAFREHWRAIADAADVPKEVWNMDCRGQSGTQEEVAPLERERESAR